MSDLKSNQLHIYNSLSRKKEKFEPIKSPFVGMYVCGPTVYGDAHLGHARPAIAFDIVFRYLKYLGYKVRYVRNITDVGHLENDADYGEDKIAKKAKLEQLEPMEIAQYFTDRYLHDMQSLNVLPPSIQPHASGHIIEQIEMAQKIQEAGLAYESNGSLYFDVKKYNQNHNYGILSGRNLDEVIANTRSLDGQDEKRDQVDFALWKKASPEHIMRWKSPWSDGFPGWHMECSAMSTKYLGENFDIHGGGMDLKFPHHESEIAQSVAANGSSPVKYWMHNNMVTINGQKMGKSLGNFITLEQFFTGDHPMLEKKYDPMTIRFFMLQAHYRSTLDFSNEALQAAEKGLNKLLNTVRLLPSLKSSETSDADIKALIAGGFEAIEDDFNTPVLIAQLFEATRLVNLANDGKMALTASDIQNLTTFFDDTLFTILGLTDTFSTSNPLENVADGLIKLILEMRLEARKNKDWATSDQLRDQLKALGILVKDSKEGSTWEWDLN